MEFKAEYRSYTTRYLAGPCLVILIIFGLFLHWLLDDFFLTNLLKKSSLFFLVFASIWQIAGYLSTNKHIKLLNLDEDSLTFHFFKKPSLTLKYSEIASLEYTKDIFKNFEFVLKNGEKKMIYATLSDNKKAFDLIRQKISESKLT
jgi:hypothetical protein